MPQFSERSLEKLHTCHPDLQRLFKRVVLQFDVTILEGVRTLERQQEMVADGLSQTLRSKHLKQPDGYAHAVDVAPYPVNWANAAGRFERLGGYVLGLAEMLEIPIRWGGLWDRNLNEINEGFVDRPHFELNY